MPDQYTRTRAQLGTPALDVLRRAHVAVFGIGGVGGQAVEDATVGCEHIPLVLVGGQGVVDVGKAPGLAVLSVDLPDPILPNPLDGDGLLYAAGDLKRDTLAPVGRSKSFTHGGAPPF